jgi:hypothetical protein
MTMRPAYPPALPAVGRPVQAAFGGVWALALAAAVQAQPAASSRPVATVQAPAAADAPLSDAEMAVAAQVYVGTLPCELGQTVTLQPDAERPGYFQLSLGRERYQLRPVVSRTGAVRLEDLQRGAVWLQLPHKSMLMSQRLGRRLADECAGPVQRTAAEALRLQPAPDLLDVAQSPRRE